MASYCCCSHRVPPLLRNPTPQFFPKFPIPPQLILTPKPYFRNPKLSNNNHPHTTSTNAIYQETESISETEEEEEETDYDSSNDEIEDKSLPNGLPSVMRRRRRYRKQYPGEKQGITEEMRFVAMKLRNDGRVRKIPKDESYSSDDSDNNKNGDIWEPSLEGFLKYLVDSHLVFTAVERIVDESTDVSFVYFRNTGLERSGRISKDLEWFREQGNVIPEPSNPGITYVKYLEELAENSPQSFLCHFYNIYFSHITGGQVIAKQVCEKILQGRVMEFYTWDGDAEDTLKSVRKNLNALSEHWSRDEKNKCLREATKSFRYLGQIVRLIIS